MACVLSSSMSCSVFTLLKTRSTKTAMQVWGPTATTNNSIMCMNNNALVHHVQHCLQNKLIPYIEHSLVQDINTDYDNMYTDVRYWTMWKTPLYDCDSECVLRELSTCIEERPFDYVRISSFHPEKNIQCSSLIVNI